MQSLPPVAISDAVCHTRIFVTFMAFILLSSMAMHPPIDDEQIVVVVTACQRGETGAIEQLYDLYADRLYRYMLTRVVDHDLAADLTTELFVKVIEHAGRFRLPPSHPAASFSAWLYRIAANLVAGHFRKHRRLSWMSLEEQDTRPDPATEPVRVVEGREERVELAQAMHSLSEDQRLVINARYVEAMSNAEIAQMLGKSEGAIKALQHRALRSLARVLNRQKAGS